MSPARNERYRGEAMAELARSLRYGPPEARAAQLRRAEALHDELETGINYPIEFISYRVTGQRPTVTRDTLLPGAALRPDLRQLIDELSLSLGPPPGEEAAEHIPLEALAERFRVSHRTVHRWREEGLRWRRIPRRGGGRPRVVFLPGAVEHFLGEHGKRVSRASAFTPLGAAARKRILADARDRAARGPTTLQRLARALAARHGRSVQGVRELIERHDRAHPEAPILPARRGPLSDREKRLIARAARRGIPAARLAERFERTRASIYRVIHQVRGERLRAWRRPYHAMPTFDRPDAESVLLRPRDPAAEEAAPLAPAPPPGARPALPEVLEPAFRHTPPSEATQHELFVRYNFLKYRAGRLIDALDPHHPRAAALGAAEAAAQAADALRRELYRRHLPLLLAAARRELIGRRAAGPNHLMMLLGAGKPVLLEAIETFDPRRAQTFTHYLSYQLMRAFARKSTGRAARRQQPEALLKRLLEPD